MRNKFFRKEFLCDQIVPELAAEAVSESLSKVVEKVVATFRKSKRYREQGERYRRIFQSIDPNMYDAVLSELASSEKGKEDIPVHSKKVLLSKRDIKKQDRRNGKVIARLSAETLLNSDFRAFLRDASHTFSCLTEEQQDGMAQLLEECVKEYVRNGFLNDTDESLQIASVVIVNSVKDFLRKYFDTYKDDLKDELQNKDFTQWLQEQLKWYKEVCATRLCEQGGGNVSFQRIQMNCYTPQYMLLECPHCGYDGEKIFLDEHNNRNCCAACGKSWSFLEANPQVWQEIDAKAELLLTEVDEVKSALAERERTHKENAETLRKELREDIRNGIGVCVTQEYLTKCLNDNTEQTVKYVDSAVMRYKEELKVCLKGCSTAEIHTLLQKKTQEDELFKNALENKLEVLGEQLTDIYALTEQSFADQTEKTEAILENGELLLEHIGQLCTKEYMDEFAGSLGADLKAAVLMSSQNHMQKQVALTEMQTAQIITQVRALIENSTSGMQLNKNLQEEMRQIGGQISGVEQIIQKCDNENKSLLRTIIRKLDEVRMTSLGLEIDRNFADRYAGRIPSKYIINEEFGGPFPCPYCGAIEERKLRPDQVCQCSVCGMQYLAVDPFAPVPGGSDKDLCINRVINECGRRADDEYLATKEKVKQWRAERTAKFTPQGRGQYRIQLGNGTIKPKQGDGNAGIMLIPTYDENDRIIREIRETLFVDACEETKVITLLIGDTVEHLTGTAFIGNYNIKTVVFYKKNNMNFSLEELPENVLLDFREKLRNGKAKLYGNKQ